MFIPLYLYVEMLACIHCEPVYYHLTKEVEVTIGSQRCPDFRIMPPFTEITIDYFLSRIHQQADGNYAYCHESIP
jgi:hypothetical protein